MHAIISAAEWTLGAETAEGAPAGIYSTECRPYGAQAQPTDEGCLRANPYAEREARGAFIYLVQAEILAGVQNLARGDLGPGMHEVDAADRATIAGT